MKESSQKFIAKPKNIFLLDSFGALLTTIMLYFILRRFNAFFGLSKDIFEHLSSIAFTFFIYSISCYFFVQQKWKAFLKIICTANILYCTLIFCIIIYNYESISTLGIVYFLGEIAVIAGIVFLEIKTIR
ncbi:hypothetical protein ACFSJW_18520 [Flavobacterium artemisiae]|uniref:Transporter n=1 Tax=Flavobacterium artemisiae TaxID=2126556 RepID=A0ABW4HAU4_9FLAO